MAKLVLIIVVVSYLLGSIPFGYLLVRIFRDEDVRQRGSGNIGATNVARTGSKGLAVATLLLDAMKGYAAVVIAERLAWMYAYSAPAHRIANGVTWEVRLDSDEVFRLAALAAFIAILGHMFTIWLKFKGGKGVATAAGSFAALAPRATLIVLLLFVVVVAVTRYVSLGSIIAAASFPVSVWWLMRGARANPPVMLLISASSLLIILRHKDNIRRLLAGTESRFR